MSRSKVWNMWGGLALIVLGALFLFDQFFPFNLMGLMWPLFIIFPGLMFFAGMISGGKNTAGLAIPGAIVTTLGFMLFVQNAFNIWATWAYAWALLIVAIGAGLWLFGVRAGERTVRAVGIGVGIIGALIFFFFGTLFELSALLMNARSLGGAFWGLLLISIGALFIFWQVGGLRAWVHKILDRQPKIINVNAYSPQNVPPTGAQQPMPPAPDAEIIHTEEL